MSAEPPPQDLPPADGWGAMATLISGLLVWGGVGWLLSEWLGSRAFLVLGMLFGIGASLYLVWLRYGRH